VTNLLIQDFEEKYISNIQFNFDVGDTIHIHTKIVEGEKERIQVFTGIVIALKGKGLSKTVTLYRNAYGCSMERVFLLNSPRITKITLEKKGKVRKAKLYYLRGESGKKAKVQEQILGKKTAALEGESAQIEAEENMNPETELPNAFEENKEKKKPAKKAKKEKKED